jgi:hypothetical protein
MRTIAAILWYLGVVCVQAQGLYHPIEYRPSFENGTRRLDGTVSETYWQNRGEYVLKATVDPAKRLLTGTADITYYNNSPQTLDNIVFHAYHDMYKPGAKREHFYPDGVPASILTEGMVVDACVVDGRVVDLKNRRVVNYGGTNYRVALPNPLKPGGSLKLTIKWHYTIPGEGFERSGAINPTSMFIGYWYPEIAVYDDINGWDRVLYDGTAEFYHDVNDYSVEIDLPANYLVWASVPPDNAQELYPKVISDRLALARKSTEPVTIVGKEDYAKGVKVNSTKWKFTAKGFPDFAFAFSDKYIWQAAQYKDDVGDYFVHIAYDPANASFASVLKAQQASLKIFHSEYPRYAFPYKNFTIFNGLAGGGMEFPGMANDEAYTGAEFSRWMGRKVTDLEANMSITMHEMFHMYFPFLMGINEKRFAWMDEGLADFVDHFIPPVYESTWNQEQLGRQVLPPMMVPTFITPVHSQDNSYTVGSYSYYSLYHLLGKDLFLKCLNEYMDRWKYKHPTPYDYFYTFNDVSGQDLTWFWKRWYFDWGYPDLAIVSFENNVLTVSNEGGRPLAFKLTYTYADKTTTEEMVSPAVWKDSDVLVKKTGSSKEITGIRISILGGSDALVGNNVWRKN